MNTYPEIENGRKVYAYFCGHEFWLTVDAGGIDVIPTDNTTVTKLLTQHLFEMVYDVMQNMSVTLAHAAEILNLDMKNN